MARFASIDIGTNTVLLLVAERRNGSLVPVVERAEITRLGRGVDRTGRLDPAAIRDTVEVLGRYAREARALGARSIACVATSAARDARNAAEFFEAAREAAGLTPEVVSGDEEARLVYRSAWRDFGPVAGAIAPLPAGATLSVLDVGGGSTEFTYGDGPDPLHRESLQIGAVRLTERLSPHDPMAMAEVGAMRRAAREAMGPLATAGRPAERPGSRLVGIAGTVTTLAAVEQALAVYDAQRVHGSVLRAPALEALFGRLASLAIADRARLPGMEPKRADVIVAGCAILLEAMAATGFEEVVVSDRGVRWGLIYDRLG